MKFSMNLLFLGAVAVDGASPKHAPARITFNDLANGGSNGIDDKKDVFWKTLHEVGLISITDIPGFNKQAMLKDLEECLHQQTAVGAPDFELSSGNHSRGSGNRRRTLATRTLAGTPDGILVATKHEKNGDPLDVCSDLKASSETFREAVQSVSEAIAARFVAMESAATKGDDSKIPIQTLINEGEHLEHFHSYYSDNNKVSTTGTTGRDLPSIDWHTDQGMMLLFTPGQRSNGKAFDGFFIRLADGSTTEVAFDSHLDELVIMLGDGVHQYINNGDAPRLRAVPHAVKLPDSSHDYPRLWYGRMVLPPPEAIHPSSGTTFGNLRSSMIRGDSNALDLGCASASMVARELAEDAHGDEEDLECDEATSMLCWMKCMTYEELGVGPDSCDKSVVCATEEGDLWSEGIHNPDYSLRCLSEEEITSPEMGMDMEHDHEGHDHDGSSSASSRVGFGIIVGISIVMGGLLA